MHTCTKYLTTHVYCEQLCFLRHIKNKVPKLGQICRSAEKCKQHHAYEIQIKISDFFYLHLIYTYLF